MSSKSKVYFFSEDRKPSLRNRTRLKNFIESIFKKEKTRLASINYIFCSDKKLLSINREFLYHDYLTDIITFDLSETDAISAEVYISVDRVKDNARDLGAGFNSELHRVIFHGALHLCGYKDKTPAHQKMMRQKEDQYLTAYFR